MIVDLHRKSIWALGNEVTLETIEDSDALRIDRHRKPRVIEYINNYGEDTLKD